MIYKILISQLLTEVRYILKSLIDHCATLDGRLAHQYDPTAPVCTHKLKEKKILITTLQLLSVRST